MKKDNNNNNKTRKLSTLIRQHKQSLSNLKKEKKDNSVHSRKNNPLRKRSFSQLLKKESLTNIKSKRDNKENKSPQEISLSKKIKRRVSSLNLLSKNSNKNDSKKTSSIYNIFSNKTNHPSKTQSLSVRVVQFTKFLSVIYGEFIKDNSEHELNISKEEKKSLLKHLEKLKTKFNFDIPEKKATLKSIAKSNNSFISRNLSNKSINTKDPSIDTILKNNSLEINFEGTKIILGPVLSELSKAMFLSENIYFTSYLNYFDIQDEASKTIRLLKEKGDDDSHFIAKELQYITKTLENINQQVSLLYIAQIRSEINKPDSSYKNFFIDKNGLPKKSHPFPGIAKNQKQKILQKKVKSSSNLLKKVFSKKKSSNRNKLKK